ncbi:uncharacterized protein [Halyomorpha halys]|uniref:uncharacterized protein n=1 Tax=Halyomorpha halys TaxID=286706 RepID=UPI0006D4E65A|nr:uncharacterized protein LOC106692974 [Halyomorpha halys]
MAPLPRARFKKTRPFAQTGVDYTGPFLIKESKRRNASLGKAYLCLFICMSSKALHLELVSALTTKAFLTCLDCFISRCGAPSTISSDHGTNFVGASRFLKEIYRFQVKNQTAVTNNLALNGVEWKFIPPRAHHFRGLWEAGIKSVKRLLSSSVGSQPFTFEELATALVKIEALLNSRPLCPLTEDACSRFFDTWTLPRRAETPRSSSSSISKWRVVEAQIAQLWNRWRKEYLHTLQQRQKWTKKSPTPEVGDLVILLEKRSLVGQWPVARVSKTFPGRDGVTRTLMVSGSYLTRAVTSVIPLFYPSGTEDDNTPS